MKNLLHFKRGRIISISLIFLVVLYLNDMRAQTVIEMDQTYNFTQAPTVTVDYELEIPLPGQVTIHIDSWISTYNWGLDYDRLYIFNSEGNPISRNQFSSEEDPFLFHMFQENQGLTFNIGQAGEYTISVHSGQLWGENWQNDTMQNYQMSVTAVYCEDDYEPNDDLSTATVIMIGVPVSAWQWRHVNSAEVEGDEDWYVFSIDTPGRMIIQLVEWNAIYNWSADYDRLYVYNENEESIGQNGGNDCYAWMMGGGTPSEPVVIEMNLSHAGSYFLGFHAGAAHSTTPYSFNTQFIPADDPFEPNDDFTTAKQIPDSDTWYQAWAWRSLDSTMNVVGDEDFYYFFAAGPGEYSLTLDGWIPIFNWGADYDRLEIYDADENPVGASPFAWMMGTDPIVFEVPDEGKYYLQLHCGGTYSLEGYQFKLSGSFFGINDQNNSDKEAIIYPNPANDQIFLAPLHGIGNAELLSIFNINGELILYEAKLLWQTPIDVSRLDNGIYFLEISTDKGPVRQKFCIQR